MKTKIFSILFLSLFVFLTLVSADIISVNSGGDTGLVINPDNLIEAFFFGGNNFPVTTNVLLISSAGTNTTYENLSVSFSSTDADKDTITNITDWRVGGNSIARLNLAFDKRIHTGEVRDYSTYLNNGTLGGGISGAEPTWVFGGQIGGAYDFDGSDDYIDIDDHASLKGFSELTISFWVNPETSQTAGIIDKNRASEWNVHLTSNQVRFEGENSGSSTIRFTSNSAISSNQWTHVVVVYNGSIKKIYFGGVEQAITINDNAVGDLFSSTNPVYMGKMHDGYYFNGSIDEVKIYNRSLSQEQIVSLYNQELTKHMTILVSQETEKGETWQVAVTPNDIFDDGITVLSNNLTIVDIDPEDPTSVTLISLNARNESDTDLNCSAFISDMDNELLTVYVNWLKDNVSQYNQSFASQNNATTFSTLLNNNNLTLADVWKCSVRTYDDSAYSSWIDSNELTIIDITSPNVTIISPNSSLNYTTLNVDFNVSVADNENISMCFYNINNTVNITMTEINDSYFWYAPDNLTPGTHNLTYYCNDTSGNWGTNSTNYTILDEAAISISLSPSLAFNVNWSLTYLPVDDLGAVGNNESGVTTYYVNISATNVNVDLYVKADGDLLTDSLDVLGLGNETYAVNFTNSSVPDLNRLTMTTGYILIGENLPDASIVYMKFYLDAPVSQPAGTYLNSLDFKAVRNGGPL